jgi:hypothetical protein
MHERYLALRRACGVSWYNGRETLISASAARIEMDNWQDTQSQAKDYDSGRVIEDETLIQEVCEVVLTSEAQGKCAGREQEIDLVADDGAPQSESNCGSGNDGTEEGGILSVVSSGESEV